MIRKILIIGLVGLILTVLTGCPGWYDHYAITGIDLTGAEIAVKGKDKADNRYQQVQTFETSINFILSYDFLFISYVSDYSSACYALTRGTKYDNELIEETIIIKFDKNFIYDGNIIVAGKNILDAQDILSETDFFQGNLTYNSGGADKIIEMSDMFIEKAKFDTTEYKVIISGMTSDNKMLVDSVSVRFRIKK